MKREKRGLKKTGQRKNEKLNDIDIKDIKTTPQRYWGAALFSDNSLVNR